MIPAIVLSVLVAIAVLVIWRRRRSRRRSRPGERVRAPCDGSAALAMLHEIVLPPVAGDAELTSGFRDLASQSRLRREFTALRLFAVLAANRETRFQDWRDRGRDLFDPLLETTLASTVAEHHEAEAVARAWLTERIKYYMAAGAATKSMSDLETGVGNRFGLVFSKPPPEALARLGVSVFLGAFEQTLARHAAFMLG